MQNKDMSWDEVYDLTAEELAQYQRLEVNRISANQELMKDLHLYDDDADAFIYLMYKTLGVDLTNEEVGTILTVRNLVDLLYEKLRSDLP